MYFDTFDFKLAGADAHNLGLQHPVSHLGHTGNISSIQIFPGIHSFLNSDCYPQVEAEGGDSCRPRSEALESGKGQIHHNVVTFVWIDFGLDWLFWFGLVQFVRQ